MSNGSYTTKVFRLGDTEPLFILYGLPGHQSWQSKAERIADYFQCDRDDVSTRELDDGVEAIVIGGEIVGSFDMAITPAIGE